MSSIYGVYLNNGQTVNERLAKHIDDTTSWWKPDSSFQYVNETILLGQQNMYTHRLVRLEKDSIFNHPSELKIVSDARIDNREDIIRELNCRHDISNSELILLLYLGYGNTCAQKLIGAFTFAIWDSKNKTLVCARDQMGIKPFCYYSKNGLFAFGTQKKSLLAIPDIDKTPDWRYIMNSMSTLGIPKGTTEYNHIKHLAPGHLLILKNNELQLQQYWELDIRSELKYKNDSNYVEEFNALFKESVRCRIDGTNTFAAHLSGGLDSSGITSIAHQIAENNSSKFKVLSYNIIEDYKEEEKKIEENLRAFDLVDFLKADSIFTNVNKPIERSIYDMIKHEVVCCDGRSRSNNINTEYEIQAEAKQQNATVLLSGFGGDELVTSFCRPFYLEYFDKGNWIKYFTSKKKSRHELKDRMRAFIPALSAKLIPSTSKYLSLKYSKERYKGHQYKAESIFLNKDYFNSTPALSSILVPEYFTHAHDEFPTSLKAYQRNHICRPHTYRRMESEQLGGKYWHVNYRYPMMDIRLLQFMISIPMEQKISEDMSRRIFRLAMKDYLPDSIRLRDMKHAGHLKPLAAINLNPKKKEIYDFVQELKTTNRAPFLDLQIVERWLKSKKSPYSLYPWMIFAQLGYEDKLDFT